MRPNVPRRVLAAALRLAVVAAALFTFGCMGETVAGPEPIPQALGSTAYSDAVLADNPQIYWHLGEAAGSFADASGHGNAASVSGTGILRAQPNVVASNADGAVTFTNGATQIADTTPSGLASARVSVEVWFKVAAYANYIDFASHNWGGTGGYGWAIFSTAAGNVYFGLYQSGGSQLLVNSPVLSANAVHHAVGTYDGSIERLYIDGAQVASRSVGALALDTSAPVLTGLTDTTARVSVDEFAVYNSALSAARIATHYAAAALSPNGATCTAGSQCGSGNCVDGFCCTSACSGSCDVCSAALGASANGTCTNAANYAGSPSCAPYLCKATSASCPSSCTTNADCSSGNTCNGGVCGASATYASTVLADNPQIYWHLGEASGSFTDASGHGNAASVSGTGVLRAQPKLVGSSADGAVTFTNGTTQIADATPSGLSSSRVSVEVWFKVAAYANYIDLASHNWGGTGGYGWAIFSTAAGNIHFGLYQSGGSQLLVNSPVLSANAVHHAVGTYDGSIERLYIDGAQVASRSVGALALDTSASVLTGLTDTAAQVSVDELAVYNTALSAARVQAHFAAASGGGGGGVPGPIAGQGYSKVFDDEFDTLDTTTWRLGRFDHPEMPSYFSVSGGVLSITNTDQPDLDLMTRSLAWRYGYFEARMWYTADTSSWASHWLMSDNWIRTRDCTTLKVSEIDWLESNHQFESPTTFRSHFGTVHLNTHSYCSMDDANPGWSFNFIADTGITMAGQWHTIAGLWTPTTLSWYVDDVLLKSQPVYETTNQPMRAFLAMYRHGGTRTLVTKVDWYRVWQRP